jgi:hypothetical protein
MNAQIHLIGFAAWLARKVVENLACEFYATTKKQLFTHETSMNTDVQQLR